MKLFLFHFSDRPYGGRFIAVIHNTEEEALEKALEVARPRGARMSEDFRRNHNIFVRSTGIPVEIGGWVDGDYQE